MIDAFVDFAADQFELDTVQKDGSTLRQHLAGSWERSGIEPRRLADAPALPDALEPLWLDFMELHASRANSGFGPSRISFAEIEAFQRVRGGKFLPWQIDAIRRADAKYIASRAKSS